MEPIRFIIALVGKRRIGRDREALPLFLNAVRELAGADGAVSEEERRFIEEMVNKLRDMA